MKVEIIRINDNGDGIGYIDGKVIFVPKTIPGDIVLIKDKIDYKNYSYSTKWEVINSKSCDIKCPYYNLCGGCQIMGLNYDKQLEYKKNKVINIFKKYNKMDINPMIYGSNQYNYRNKIILHVKEGKLGLVTYRSHDIVKIDKCLLVSDNINNIIMVINNNIDLLNVNKVMIRESTNKDIMVVFYGSVDKDIVIKYLSNLVKSIYVNDNLIWGRDAIISKLGNYKYEISPKSFFQVNYIGMFNIYNKVLEYIDNDSRVLDLYCGTGSIGIYVSNRASSILGIEINKGAIDDANKNKDINNIDNISFVCGNVDSIIKDNYKYDIVIVDPPRSGLNKKTKDILLGISSKKIIYVSCDPITLARDINYLSVKYDLVDINLVDMFPNTYHVESVCMLERK